MLGFTGVVWYPRGATVNSFNLDTGAGPIPLGAASASWAELSAVLAGAGAELTAVTAGLAAAWQGVAADVALVKLAGFDAWLGQTAAHAATMAGLTTAGAAAYAVAAAVMPSLAEIAVTQAAAATAVAAGAAGGPALAGAGAAAETAQRELDIRAAIAMEGYEAASTVLSVPIPFSPAPPIAGIGAAAGQGGPTPFDPVVAVENLATQAASAIGTNPLGSVPGSVVAEVGNIAGGAVSTVASGATTMVSAAGQVAMGGLGGGLGGASPMVGASAVSTVTPGGVTAVPQLGMLSAAGNGGVGLPAGWAGSAGGMESLPRAGGSGFGPGAPGPVAGLGGAAPSSIVGSAAAEPVVGSRTGTGPAMAGGRGMGAVGGHDDEGERDAPDYLRHFEHFADGRVVVPAVIGGASETR